MRLDFQNRYGRLVLSLVSDVIHVDKISGKNVAAEHKFDIRIAEKIALITDNRGIQICPVSEGGKWLCYVVVHDTPSTAAVAEVALIEYVGGDPTQEIRDARPRYTAVL